MLKAVWNWFLGLFTKEKIGILFKLLFKSGVSVIAQAIADRQLQQKALDYARELSQRKELSSTDRAAEFNKKMAAYGTQIGKGIGESVINCLRELAVNALKAERGL